MSRRKNLLRITEAAVLAAITIIIMIVLSWTLGTCVEVPEWLENGYGITFHCEDGRDSLRSQPMLVLQAFMDQPLWYDL